MHNGWVIIGKVGLGTPLLSETGGIVVAARREADGVVVIGLDSAEK